MWVLPGDLTHEPQGRAPPLPEVTRVPPGMKQEVGMGDRREPGHSVLCSPPQQGIV